VGYINFEITLHMYVDWVTSDSDHGFWGHFVLGL